MSTSTHLPATAAAPNLAQLLDWMATVRAIARSAGWGRWCDVGGIDVLDLLQTPLYLAVLQMLRSPSAAAASWPRRLSAALQRTGYHWRQGLRDRRAARVSAQPAPTDILFWTRDPTHTSVMLPVARAVAARGARCRFLACRPSIFGEVRRTVPDAVYSGGGWPRAIRLARRDGAQRARAIARSEAWQLPPLAGASGHELERVYRTTLGEQLPVATEALASAREALAAFRPRVLVVGNDLTVEGRAACAVAAAHGTPTAMFMHGAIDDNATQAYHLADKIFAASARQRAIFEAWGLDEERVTVCGAPQLDALPRQSGQTHPLLQKQFGLRPDEPFVLVATSGPGHRISHAHHQIVIELIERLSRELPSTPFLVKLHLKDRPEYYRAALARPGQRRLFVQAGRDADLPSSIVDWLQNCRAVLTGASTVATEAMLMGVPVVTMDFQREIRGVDFIEAGATRHVTTFEQLAAAVNELLQGEALPADLAASVQRYLAENFHTLDGRASDRGAVALLELGGLALGGAAASNAASSAHLPESHTKAR